MIVVTGALGFIGSCLVRALNDAGHGLDVIVVDDFYKDHKEANLDGKIVREWIHRDIFLNWFHKSHAVVDFVFHLGARTDTVDPDPQIFQKLNLDYSKTLWTICARHDIPMIYASSAATYGNGEFGFSDGHDLVDQYLPLNEYARSKNAFDAWALKQKETPPKWAGLKFFNVYGPNEYHKNRMASVIFHAYNQIRKTGKMKLFRSHRPDFEDGHQRRDFIYVKDVVDMCMFFKTHDIESGLYNIGTGQARTFLDLVHATFSALDMTPDIEFIDTPEDIRENYQYFTEAEMDKLARAGYENNMTSLEAGVREYVQDYLMTRSFF